MSVEMDTMSGLNLTIKQGNVDAWCVKEITDAEIGEPQKEVTFEPIPDNVPVPETVPQKEPEKVPA